MYRVSYQDFSGGDYKTSAFVETQGEALEKAAYLRKVVGYQDIRIASPNGDVAQYSTKDGYTDDRNLNIRTELTEKLYAVYGLHEDPKKFDEDELLEIIKVLEANLAEYGESASEIRPLAIELYEKYGYGVEASDYDVNELRRQLKEAERWKTKV